MNVASHDHSSSQSGHGSLKSYVIGFVFSVILTAIPFWLVMTKAFANSDITLIAITAFAVVQMIVHIFCFLHVNAKSEDGWTIMALIFTAVMVLIVLTGSMWVMYNLNMNMMPSHEMSPHDASQMP